MKPSLSKLKIKNPFLIFYSDKKIEEAVIFLEKEGFFWKEDRNIFYSPKTKTLFSAHKIEKLLRNEKYFIESVLLSGRKTEEEREERVKDVKTIEYLINFIVFLIIVNLFLGHLFFHILIWILLELIFLFLLFSFIKIKKIENKK